MDQWTSSPASLHVLEFILHSLLSQPLLLLSSQRQQERHKGCLCCEPAASLQQVPSSDCQWDTLPDLSTCTDVVELRHCVDFFFFSLTVLHSLLCVCSFKKHLDYSLCPFFLLIHTLFKDLLCRVQLKLFIILRSNTQCNISI